MDEEKPDVQQGGPIITFHARGKTFRRVFKDQSFDKTKDAVRKKLGLPSESPIRLVQLQGGERIELEDDDDFEAFRIAARSNLSMEVFVAIEQSEYQTVSTPKLPTEDSSGNLGNTRKRKRKNKATLAYDDIEPSASAAGLTARARGTGSMSKQVQHISNVGVVSGGSSASPVTDTTRGPPAKRKKKNSGGVASPETPDPTQVRIISSQDRAYGQSSGELGNPNEHVAISTARPLQQAGITVSAPALPNGASNNSTRKADSSQDRLTEVDPATKSVPITALPKLSDSVDAKSTLVPSREVSAVPKSRKRKRKSMANGDLSVDGARAFATEPIPIPTALATMEGPIDEPPRKKKSKKVKSPAELEDHFSPLRADPASVDSSVQDGLAAHQKRKHHRKDDTPQLRDVDSSMQRTPSAVLPSVITAEVSSKEAGSSKRRDSRTAEPGPAEVDESSMIPTPLSDSTKSSVEEREKISFKLAKSKANGVVISEFPSDEQSRDISQTKHIDDSKGTRKRKKSSTTVTGHSPNDTRGAEPLQVSSQKQTLPARSKRKRKSDQSAVNVEQPTGPSEGIRERAMETKPAASSSDLLAIVEAAVHAVTARGLTSRSASADPGGADLSKIKPTSGTASTRRKEKLGKSKLSVSWVPEGHTEQSIAMPQDDGAPMKRLQSPRTTSVTAPLEQVAAISDKVSKRSKKGSTSGSQQCPVCHQTPFHLRFKCPVVVAGADSIERRITELAQGGQDIQLVEELKTLLARARRKGVSQGGGADLLAEAGSSTAPMSELAPTNTITQSSEILNKPQDIAQSSEPPSSLMSPSRRASLTPRIPAGSEIAEVVVEGQDEGSSNESSSSDDENDKEDDVPPASNTNTDLANIDVDALLHGPKLSREDVFANLSSDASSDEEADQEVHDFEDEDAEDRKFRRLSRKFERADSSDDDVQGDAGSDDIASPAFMEVDPNDTLDEQNHTHQGRRSTPVSMAPEDRVVNIDMDQSRNSDGIQPMALAKDTKEKPKTLAETEATSDAKMDVSHETARVDALISPVPEIAIVNPIADEGGPPLEGQNTSSIAPFSELSVAAETIVSSTPITKELQPGQEDLADPIESADDLMRPDQQSRNDDDPIEGDYTQPQGERQRSTPPPLSTPKLGTAKRMKDRHGKLPGSDSLPVLASVFSEALAQSTPAPTSKRGQSPTTQDVSAAFQNKFSEEGVARRTRMATRKSTPITSMPPPPTPLPAPAPKRKGRQSEEEKARKAAERKAEKDRKAAERKAEREKVAAEKKAEKEKIAAEKKAKRDAEKAEKVLAKKGGKGGKSALSVAPDSKSTAYVAPPILDDTRNVVPGTPQPAASEPRPLVQSVVKWTVLTQDSSLMDADSSAFDELHPSSPPHSLPQASSSLVDEPLHDVAGNMAEDTINEGDRTVEVQVSESRKGIQNKDDTQMSDPLFLPDSSQYPQVSLIDRESPITGARDASPAHSASGSDEEDLRLSKTPAPPRSWASLAPFRRLSDLASQQLFTPLPVTPDTSFALKPAAAIQNADRRHEDDDEEDDDEDDETDGLGSDSDANPQSHIPQERRAGAGVQKKKTSGLLAYFAK
ncbi:hypothetical protein AcV7_004102 [Taiwanofungus camphoratus]|nr:hypothetical protein AcV7_004102 [Antrodia cinnamomea]